jgi:hypothetical protein
LRAHRPDAGGYHPANVEGVEHSVEATLFFSHADEHLDLRGSSKSHDINPALDYSVDEGPGRLAAPFAHPVHRQVADCGCRLLKLCEHWPCGLAMKLHNH